MHITTKNKIETVVKTGIRKSNPGNSTYWISWYISSGNPNGIPSGILGKLQKSMDLNS